MLLDWDYYIGLRGNNSYELNCAYSLSKLRTTSSRPINNEEASINQVLLTSERLIMIKLHGEPSEECHALFIESARVLSITVNDS